MRHCIPQLPLSDNDRAECSFSRSLASQLVSDAVGSPLRCRNASAHRILQRLVAVHQFELDAPPALLQSGSFSCKNGVPHYAIEFCIDIRGLAVCSVDAFVVHSHHAVPTRSHTREQHLSGLCSIGVLPSRHTPKSHEPYLLRRIHLVLVVAQQA